MEGFLRAYYTNLNPNATEEEILAYLASQGFEGMGNQPVEGGITMLKQNPMLLPQLGGDGGDPPPPPGSAGPRRGNYGVTGLFDILSMGATGGIPVASIANYFANKRADQGSVEVGMPTVTQTDVATIDEMGTVGGSERSGGGTFGTSTNDASTFSDYS